MAETDNSSGMSLKDLLRMTLGSGDNASIAAEADVQAGIAGRTGYDFARFSETVYATDPRYAPYEREPVPEIPEAERMSEEEYQQTAAAVRNIIETEQRYDKNGNEASDVTVRTGNAEIGNLAEMSFTADDVDGLLSALNNGEDPPHPEAAELSDDAQHAQFVDEINDILSSIAGAEPEAEPRNPASAVLDRNNDGVVNIEDSFLLAIDPNKAGIREEVNTLFDTNGDGIFNREDDIGSILGTLDQSEIVAMGALLQNAGVDLRDANRNGTYDLNEL